MKKIQILLGIALLSSFAVSAQQIGLRGGFAYTTEIEKLGLNLGGQYSINPEIDLSAGFTFFTGESTSIFGTTIKSNFWMFDIDGHYNFNVENDFTIYPLVGLNFTTASVKIGDNRDSTTELGLNIGGGAKYALTDALDAFFELKYIIGDFDQGVIGLGVVYKL